MPVQFLRRYLNVQKRVFGVVWSWQIVVRGGVSLQSGSVFNCHPRYLINGKKYHFNDLMLMILIYMVGGVLVVFQLSAQYNTSTCLLRGVYTFSMFLFSTSSSLSYFYIYLFLFLLLHFHFSLPSLLSMILMISYISNHFILIYTISVFFFPFNSFFSRTKRNVLYHIRHIQQIMFSVFIVHCSAFWSHWCLMSTFTISSL